MTIGTWVSHRAARFLIVAMVLVTGISQAAEAVSGPSEGLPPLKEGVHEPLIERVNQGQVREYSEIVKLFDAHLAAQPSDIPVAVERCRFIEYFAGSEDDVIESSIKDYEACNQGLKQSAFAGDPLVQLYLLEQKYGDEGIARGEALLRGSKEWSAWHKARLHERLSELYSSRDVMKAGPHAVQALRIDPDANGRLIAAEYLIRAGAKAKAVTVLEEMPAEKWHAWHLSSAVKLLVGAEVASAAHRLVEANKKIKLSDNTRLLLARSLFVEGKGVAARGLMKSFASGKSGEDETLELWTLRELFELERDYGSTKSASAAYRRLRAEGYDADPLARHRLSLALHHPLAPWRFVDLVGIGALVLLICFVALLPLVVVIPLHYWSVVRRLRGWTPEPAAPSAPWSLRHIWYALAVLAGASMLAFYCMSYAHVNALLVRGFELSHQYEVEASDRSVGDVLLITACLSLFALVPLLRRAALRPMLLGHWSVKRSVLTGAGTSIGFLVVVAVVLASTQKLFGAGLGTETTRGLQGIQSTYGTAVMFLFVAGLVPVVEELVFRGVLFKTAARYCAIWVAAIVQAGVFMVWHEDADRYPFIFGLALLAAWLAHRSGGLLAPITMHAVNNSFAALTLFSLAQGYELGR